ncbi:MAG TPA: RING finger protein, partial [Candidatus Ozemobacteraceae bacterium]
SPTPRNSAVRPGTPAPAGSPPPRVTPEPARDEQIGKTCSTCGTGISRGELVVTCPLCSLPYHHDCWKEIGGCGTYGCKAAPAVTKTEPVAEDTFTPGWTAEKKCPACQSSILANAVICKYCKAVFPTERPMTAAEWATREYDGTDLVRMRNLVIAQFVASALGCLFIFSLPANLIAMFTESWLFDVKRLPPPLRILFYAGVGVSALWGALALFFGIYSVLF